MSMLPEEWLPDDYTGPSAGTFDSITGKDEVDVGLYCDQFYI